MINRLEIIRDGEYIYVIHESGVLESTVKDEWEWLLAIQTSLGILPNEDEIGEE